MYQDLIHAAASSVFGFSLFACGSVIALGSGVTIQTETFVHWLTIISLVSAGVLFLIRTVHKLAWQKYKIESESYETHKVVETLTGKIETLQTSIDGVTKTQSEIETSIEDINSTLEDHGNQIADLQRMARGEPSE